MKKIVGIIVFLALFSLVIIGNNIIGLKGLSIMILGLLGILFQIALYNKKYK